MKYASGQCSAGVQSAVSRASSPQTLFCFSRRPELSRPCRLEVGDTVPTGREKPALRRFMRAFLLIIIPALAGCAAGAEPEDPAPRQPPSGTSSGKTAPAGKAAVLAEEVDLTSDQPGAAAKTKEVPLLTPFAAAEPLVERARTCYKLLAEMKAGVEQISSDLDDSGKEVTRLIRTSDNLAKNITDLANLWPADEAFRDLCGSTKRQALVLNEELSQVPRKWTHVRWSFTAALQEISKLRLRARDMAEAEPKPVPLLGKNGKPVLDKEGRQIYVDPPQSAPDPALAKREATQREVKAERERLNKIEEVKKNPPMKTDLDGN
ncbi:MAG: hypothetical protein ABSE73_11760 [Planctomycetota bacterium]